MSAPLAGLPATIQEVELGPGRRGRIHSLPALEAAGFGKISRLPICLRVVLESVLRHADGEHITGDQVRALARWQATAPRSEEIPFHVARILLQDFTGVPVLCDLAAMRSAAGRAGGDPAAVEPLIPVDLVVDHSVQVDEYGTPQALAGNMRREFARNAERYRFIKWGMQAFGSVTVVPPGIGIVHQVNLEHLARPLCQRDGFFFPDSLVGTDSHTTMINGLGVVGWGVGGIEAEVAMLGHPLHVLMPDVVGVHLHGKLPPGATATDLVLAVTETLRKAGMVGKFVEFHGPGAAALTVPDRATLANMAPEYGATMGYFPVDEQTLAYLAATGRDPADIAACRAYFTLQGMFGMPMPGAIDYSLVIDIDLCAIAPCVAGPRRPQDCIPLPALKERFATLFSADPAKDGYGHAADLLALRHELPAAPTAKAAPPEAATAKPPETAREHGSEAAPRHEIEMAEAAHIPRRAAADVAAADIGHGDVLIAAITSCTNTSNPGVMLAAGLLAKNARARGLRVHPRVKTSLAPGSRVVTDYLEKAGLLAPLAELGFAVAAYGCTTCIGNSGPLDARIETAIKRDDLICAAVLSGNRNFEARIHPAIHANFLMSPPLVVAFALAGRVGIDVDHEPLAMDSVGKPVFLRDIWPRDEDIARLLPLARDGAGYRARYSDLAHGEPLWEAVPAPTDRVYGWEPSTYIAEPPYFSGFSRTPPALVPIRGARCLAIFGDSVTTDHISPAGNIPAASPAGEWLIAHGVAPADFNSYGSRRGHHEVMVRGTFANVRIRNLMIPPGPDGARVSGGYTIHQPSGEHLTIHAAATRYAQEHVPVVVFAGADYGAGSSRDWAAKGPLLLGVRAVVARSFERIHRSNLAGMGIVPLQFADGETVASAGITGDESFAVEGLEGELKPRQAVTLVIRGARGERRITLVLRLDTDTEIAYLRHGGILPYALRALLGSGNDAGKTG
jgi:aconitate hydratase